MDRKTGASNRQKATAQPRPRTSLARKATRPVKPMEAARAQTKERSAKARKATHRKAPARAMAPASRPNRRARDQPRARGKARKANRIAVQPEAASRADRVEARRLPN